MAIKRLSEQKAMNRKVGVFGALTGKIIELSRGESVRDNGETFEYANGKVVIEGSKNPTRFSVFNTKNNPNLIDEFVAACQKNAVQAFFAAPEQREYQDDQNRTKRTTSLKILGLTDKPSSDNLINVFANHIEKGSAYGTSPSTGNSYLIFQVGVTQTWFNEKKNTDQSKTDQFELKAYGELADKIAEEHSETPDGALVAGKVQIDGGTLYIKTLSLVTASEDEPNPDSIPAFE